MFKTNLNAMPRNVWILGVAALLTDLSSEMIHSVLPIFLVLALGASTVTVGLIEGVAESVASIMKLFSGALSDWLGTRKTLVVAGYGLSTIVKPLFALAYSPAVVLMARTADRLGKGVRGAPRDALVADSVGPELRGAAFGLRQSLDTTGAFLGPAVALVLMLVTHCNYRLIFWCAVIPAVIAVLLLAAGVQEKKSTRDDGIRSPLRWRSLKTLGRQFWILVVAALLFNLGNSSDAFLLLRARQLGVPTELVPLTMVVMNITYMFSAYPAGVLSDRVGRFGLLLGGFIVYGIVYAGFAVVSTTWAVWILFAIYGLYLGMSQGVLLALVSDQVPAQQRGTAFGFINLASGLTLLPSSLLAGVLWAQISPVAPFAIGSFFAFASVAFLLLFFKDKTAPAQAD